MFQPEGEIMKLSAERRVNPDRLAFLVTILSDSNYSSNSVLRPWSAPFVLIKFNAF